MAPKADLIAAGIEAGRSRQEAKDLLRVVMGGSADDGKSTLTGRLLFESRRLLGEHVGTVGTGSPEPDAPDGGIDVAYRFFSSDRRHFAVADAPGREDGTRNMVAGASMADVAVILVDARKGVLSQTRRHAFLATRLGIRTLVLAVNKMDLVGYEEATCRRIDHEFREFAKAIGVVDITTIPISALRGDNAVEASERTPWYRGPTLLGFLETTPIDDTRLQGQALRLPVQWVNRSNPEFRGLSGRLASGRLHPGDRIRIQPSGREARIARIVAPGGDLDLAVAGQSVTVTLADEVDVSPGDLISAADAPAEVADQFESTLIWMAGDAMLPGRPYLLKIGARTVTATVTAPKYKFDVDTMAHLAAKKLERNEIGVCNLSVDRPIGFDPYADNRDTGGFILLDCTTSRTVGAGMLHFALRRAHNIHRQHVDVDKAARSALKGQSPVVLWFTGLSGAGKSTIANLVEKRLLALGRHSYLLDGDNVRHGLNRDLGFTDEDRVENVRRVAEVARLMVDSGLIVLTAFISPFRSERALARSMVEDGEFIEIHVDTPLEVAEARDLKGLYKKARRGELANFTGIDSPYEPPQAPELRVNTDEMSAEQSAERIIGYLLERGLIRP